MGSKVIPLLPEQIRELRKSQRKLSISQKLLNQLFDSICERIEEEDDSFWQQVFDIAGTTREQSDVTVEWITGTLKVTPRAIGSR